MTRPNINLKDGDEPIKRATVRVDPPEPLTSEALHDLISRTREYDGSRKPSTAAYSVPTVDGIPVEQTPLIETVDVIGEQYPGHAGYIKQYYNHRLLAAEDREYNVRLAEDQKLDAYNARAIKQNDSIDTEVKGLEEDKTKAMTQNRQTFEALHNSLVEAHQSAAAKMAKAGAEYDPANPSASSLLEITANLMRVAAAKSRLPWSPEIPKPLLPTYLSWTLSIVVGIMIGLSLGIKAQFIHPDTITREPWQALFSSMIGSAAAIFGRAGIKLGHRQASERSYLGLSWHHRISVLLCALAVDAAIGLTDCIVEQQGLLAAIHLQNAVNSLSGISGPSTGQVACFLIAAIVNIGYLVTSAWEGYLAGREEAITNLVHAQCEEIIEKKKADSAVAEALSAVAQVNVLRYHIAELESRISRPYDQKITQRQSRRLPVLDDLPQNSKERVQDANDNFCGAQEKFDAILETALRACERLPGALISLLKRKPTRRKEARRDLIRQQS